MARTTPHLYDEENGLDKAAKAVALARDVVSDQ